MQPQFRLRRVDLKVPDPGNGGTILVDRSPGDVNIVTTGVETRTLPRPTGEGWILTLVMHTYGGACTVTVTGGWNQAATATFILGTAGDWVTLHSVNVGGTYYWRVLGEEGTDAADTITAATITTLTATTIVVGTASLVEADLLKIDAITNGTQAAGKAVVADSNVNTGVSKVTQLWVGASGAEVQVTATPGELNQLDGNILTDMTEGAGITGAAGLTCEHSVEKIGGLFKTSIVIDITGLNSGGTDGDIIGKHPAAASCHIGQITAVKNGTIFAGKMTCLEVPAGGSDDIDLYAATESTGAEDAAIGDLTEAALVTAGGAWTLSLVKALTAYPAADKYLYLTGNTGDATYTAGIFLIELWGK